jgi:hypothetical protein
MAHLFHAPQRIPGKLAEDIGAGEALIVGPFASVGKAVWRVEVQRDGGGGAFLGRGWPDFAAAHGFGAGWHLALRHRGRGLLTIKAFDPSSCIRDLRAQQTAAAGKDRFSLLSPIRESLTQRNYLLLSSCKCSILLPHYLSW